MEGDEEETGHVQDDEQDGLEADGEGGCTPDWINSDGEETDPPSNEDEHEVTEIIKDAEKTQKGKGRGKGGKGKAKQKAKAKAKAKAQQSKEPKQPKNKAKNKAQPKKPKSKKKIQMEEQDEEEAVEFAEDFLEEPEEEEPEDPPKVKKARTSKVGKTAQEKGSQSIDSIYLNYLRYKISKVQHLIENLHWRSHWQISQVQIHLTCLNISSQCLIENNGRIPRPWLSWRGKHKVLESAVPQGLSRLGVCLASNGVMHLTIISSFVNKKNQNHFKDNDSSWFCLQ